MHKKKKSRKFQLLLAMVLTGFVALGFSVFLYFLQTYIYNDLLQQTLKDNKVIGEAVIKLLDKNSSAVDSSKHEAMKSACNEIQLPNGGFLCVARASDGLLVAAPGVTEADNININGALFSTSGRTSSLGYNKMDKKSVFEGFYEYPNDHYSDIVVGLPYREEYTLLVHQNNAEVMKMASRHFLPMLLLGASIALMVGVICFFAVNAIVSKYEDRIFKKNQELELAFTEIQHKNEEIESTLEQLQGKNEEITKHQKNVQASITYASRIQKAFLPESVEMQQAFAEHFVLYQPKDGVSGDFYWLTEKDHFVYFVVADCTGHGVPGALMSMIVGNTLTEIIESKNVQEPRVVMKELQQRIYKSLKQDHSDSKDGVDLCLLRYCLQSKTLLVSGSRAEFLICQNGLVNEYKTDSISIGGVRPSEENDFGQQEFDCKMPTKIYLFSDGYKDQFGGPEIKKYGSKRFRKLIGEYSVLPFAEQRQKFADELEGWKASQKQTDDVCLVGVQLF